MAQHKTFRILILGMIILTALACSLTAKADYKEALTNNLNAYADAFLKYAATMQLAEANSNMIHDDAWVADVKEKLAAIKTAGDALGSMENVPEDYIVVDDLMKLISQETSMLVDNINQVLDQEDFTKLEDAFENMNNISAYMDSATQQIESMK